MTHGPRKHLVGCSERRSRRRTDDRERDDVAGESLGLYGQSKGAEAALVAASRFDWPSAVVAVAPSAYRWQGLDRSSDEVPGSWTADGEPLPFVSFRAPPGSDDDGVEHSPVEGAGDGISLPYRPTAGTVAFGGMALGRSPAVNARAADSWPQVLEAFEYLDARPEDTD